MYGYVYIVTNLLNGKKYIGKHKYTKPEIDPAYFGSGIYFNRALEKYGSENFKREILESINNIPTICDSEEELNNSEKYYIAYFNAIESDNYYNLVEGQGGNTWLYLSEEAKLNSTNKRLNTILIENKRAAINEAISKGWKNRSKEDLEKTSLLISLNLKGKKKTEQHRKHISEGRKNNKTAVGSNNPNAGKECFTNGIIEVHLLPEEVDAYLEKGFYKGRPESVNKKAGLAVKGTKFYHKDDQVVRIFPNEFEKYELLGYKPGRK